MLSLPQPVAAAATTAAIASSTLRLLSFNLGDANDSPQWADEQDRKREFLKLVVEHQPHVLCLQESIFRASELCHLGYDFGRDLLPTKTHAGYVQLLSRLPIVRAEQTQPDPYTDCYMFPLLELDVSSLLPDAELESEASKPCTVCVSSIHLAPFAGNAETRVQQVDKIICTAVAKELPAHSLIIAGDSNMRRHESCDMLGLFDGYLHFRERTRLQRPSPLIRAQPPRNRIRASATATVDLPYAYVIVDGNLTAISDLEENDGLRQVLAEPFPALLPRFCRFFRAPGAPAHDVRTCCDLHLKPAKDGAPRPVPKPTEHPHHVQDEMTWDSFANKFNGLQCASYLARYDRIFLSNELLDSPPPTWTPPQGAELGVEELLTGCGQAGAPGGSVTSSAAEPSVEVVDPVARAVSDPMVTPPRQKMSANNVSPDRAKSAASPIVKLDTGGASPLVVRVERFELVGNKPCPPPSRLPHQDVRLFFCSDHFGFVTDLLIARRK